MSAEQRDRAARAVVARVIADEVKATQDSLRASIEPDMRPRETVTAVLPDGTEIGTVGRARPAQRVRVTDRDALVTWVAEHRPDEITRDVSTAFMAYLETSARRHGHAVDTTTGEVIPGIEVVTGNPAYRVTPSDEGRALVLDRLGDLLAGADLPALTGGETP